MDLTRTLLIGVIAVLSFMLLTEWVNFKAERVPAPEPTAVTTRSATDSADISMTPVPDPDGEVPVVAEASSGTVAPAIENSVNDLISVRTDVLRLLIDPVGGDIVETALPHYPARLENPDTPILLLENNNRRSYVAQSGLVGKDGIDRNGRALFTSDQRDFLLSEGKDTLVVDLHTRVEDVAVTKRFTLSRGEYLVQVEYIVNNQSPERWQANLFGQIKRDSSADPSSELSSGMGMVPFLGTALTQPDEHFTKFDFEDMRDKPYKEQLQGGWIAMIQHYFLSAWIPDAQQAHTYSTRVTPAGYNIGGLRQPCPDRRSRPDRQRVCPIVYGAKGSIPTEGNFRVSGSECRLRLAVVDRTTPILVVDQYLRDCR